MRKTRSIAAAAAVMMTALCVPLGAPSRSPSSPTPICRLLPLLRRPSTAGFEIKMALFLLFPAHFAGAAFRRPLEKDNGFF